ncbi:MAG: Fe-S cluster assembly sulfur transfer protein SufU [Gemmatimonadaceae bacterium]
MSDLTELYQSIILDHNRRPRNFRAMENADRTAEGRNPLCGDEVTLWLRLDGDVIADASFLGTGCAISRASASIMTVAIKGITRAEFDMLFDRFRGLVTKGADDSPGVQNALGSLAAFSGVYKFPVRVKCAILSWHALRAALEAQPAVVSTEGMA